MTKNIERILCATVLFTSVVPPALANLVPEGSPFGSGTITRDTVTGLKWLDLTVTLNRSFDDISAQLLPGGQFVGYRYASIQEVVDLWKSAGLTDIPDPWTGQGNRTSSGNYLPAITLISLIGETDIMPFPGGDAHDLAGLTDTPYGTDHVFFPILQAYDYALTGGTFPDSVLEKSQVPGATSIQNPPWLTRPGGSYLVVDEPHVVPLPGAAFLACLGLGASLAAGRKTLQGNCGSGIRS